MMSQWGAKARYADAQNLVSRDAYNPGCELLDLILEALGSG